MKRAKKRRKRMKRQILLIKRTKMRKMKSRKRLTMEVVSRAFRASKMPLIILKGRNRDLSGIRRKRKTQRG